MASPNLCIERLDASTETFEADVARLRKKLSPNGSVVSERGKQLTMSVFGEALSPQAVVERICKDVKNRGTEAVLHYARALDNPESSADSLRIPLDLLKRSHSQASAEFLSTVRQIRSNIAGFQTAILHKSVVTNPSPGVVLEQRYSPLRRVGICVPGGAAAYPSTV
ncbi:MAG: histidinol dehydrogenase, partial [Pirellula sp.]|nr:histidinol dehydrogenase [Pirellula sp.]